MTSKHALSAALFGGSGDPGLVACNSTPCSQLDEDLTPSLPPLPLEGGEDEGEEEISRE